MRIAIIVHGEPRFCEEFDLFLDQLKEQEHTFDWFFFLWKENYQPSEEEARQVHNQRIAHTYGYNLIAPNWQSVDEQWASAKIQNNLPETHNIVRIVFSDHRDLTFKEIRDNYAEEVSVENICKNWYSMKQADLLRQRHEEENGFKYDLVIRTRPDVAVTTGINFQELKEFYGLNSKNVFIPNNRRCGYDGICFCDLHAIADSNNMTIYTDLINKAWEYHQDGVKFHGETMMARHLQRNFIAYNNGNYAVEIRHLGTWKDLNTGEIWDSINVPDWDKKIYLSKFGRWE